MVTQLRRGASWTEVLGSDVLLDTDTNPGWLVLDGPSPLLARELHFHVYCPMQIIYEAFLEDRLPRGMEHTIFTTALENAWGTLCLVGRGRGLNTSWVEPPERFAPFLAAIQRFWEPLNAVGPRYTFASLDGRDLWASPNNIHFVLARSGVPIEILNSPLPPGGIAALLDRLPEWQANAPIYAD